MERLESSYNRSIKIIYDLPWATHRYILAPLSDKPHLRPMLIKRYLSFIDSLEKSKKKALRDLVQIVKKDVRSITGSNIRRIMLLQEKNSIEHLKHENVEYHSVPESKKWRIDFLKELLKVKFGEVEVSGFEKNELEEIINYLSTE